MAQSGMSTDLGKYRAPYNYSLPPQGRSGASNDRQKWAHEITLQDLLLHESGFQRSGATEDAMHLFGKTKDTITYSLIHRHFLRTRPLRWRPGTKYSYSNHGFGMWTMLIKEISGKTYRDYAIENYLTPLGLEDAVRPRTISMDELDAFPHGLNSDDAFVVLPPGNSTLGLAAGGWKASASSLLKLTKHLKKTYSLQELEDMGWKKINNKWKLSHNGLTEKGGTAYVVMYPDNYVGGGQNVSKIHIALAANIWTSTNALASLASDIAVQVPQSNIDNDFDLWSGIQ